MVTITCLILLDLFCNFAHSFSTYPRRYNRETEGGGTCPSQCRCMNLHQRGTRDVLDAVEGGSRWGAKGFKELTEMMGDAPADEGRSMVCQGLRRLPSPIPTGNKKTWSLINIWAELMLSVANNLWSRCWWITAHNCFLSASLRFINLRIALKTL